MIAHKIFIRHSKYIYNLSNSQLNPLLSVPKRGVYSFCTINQMQDIERLTSEQRLKQFQQFLRQNSQQALEKGAEMFAELQLKVQQNEDNIKRLENALETCSADTRSLIEKIQIAHNDIKLREEQIKSIEKRVKKQIADCKNFSVTTIAREILDVADLLAKSKKTSIQHHGTEDHQVIQAIKKADKEIRAIFELYGIEQFDPIGEQYNPNKQQALVSIPAPQQSLKNKVASTIRTGYTIKGRLLRSAHVGVYA